MKVFEYDNYRDFLRIWIRSQPSNGRGTINLLGKILNIHPSVISQTLAGVRDFTDEQAIVLCDNFAFDELESEYFALLVSFERAGTQRLKKHIRNKINKIREASLNVHARIKKDYSLSDSERSIFYSSYIFSAIRLFCSIGEGKTVEQVAEKFEVPRVRVLQHLNFLLSCGLVVESGGLYKMGPAITYLEANSVYINRHHTNWRLKALENTERLTDQELMFSGPLSIAKKDFEKVRERIIGVIKDVSETVRSSNAEDLACLNIDLFWVGK